MKKILKFLAMGLIAVPLALASCSDDKTNETPGPGPGPGPDPDPEPGLTVLENDFAPIEVCNGDYEADEAGVSVKILKKELKNIIFEVNPGENIKSYKLDIYPLASIYSTLQNNSLDPQTGAATKDKYTVEETREVIYNLHSRGITGDQRDLLITPEKVADFSSTEWDWADSGLQYVLLVPDAYYLIVVQGYYDEAGKEPSDDMTVCYVKTETQELVGNPELGCKPIEGYFGVQTIHYLNEDAPYFYYFAGPLEGRGGCQFYYDTFGERMFIDFIRHTTIGGPARRDGDENNAVWQMEAPSGTKIFWAGIPLDANEVPNLDGFIMHTLTVKTVDPDAPVAEVETTVSKVAADSFWVNYKVNKACARYHYNVFTAEDAKKIETMSDDQLEAFKIALINNSWICPNPNFKYSAEQKELLGEGYEGMVIDWDCRFDRVQTIAGLSGRSSGSNMQLGTDYVVVGVGVNPFLQGGNVSVSEPFQLKSFNKTEPTKCETKIDLELTALGRNGLNFKFTYDYGKCSQIYFGWTGRSEGVGYENFEDATREQWLALLLDKRFSGEAGPNAIPWANIWAGDQTSGIDGTGIAGLDQNQKYGVVYCATDMNGVVSEIKYAEYFIKEVVGGKNPVTTITYEAVAGKENTYNIIFNSNEDMYTFNYGIFEASSQATTGLADIKTGFYSYEEYIKIWTDLASGELPLKANNLTVTRAEQLLKENCVILALPFGRDPETKEDVVGELSYLLYIDGEFHDLEEYAKHEK